MRQEIINFLRRHWLHLLLIAPGAIAVTILHESAHAVAVWLQGGTVLRFVWIPEAGKWGYISYEFPDGATYSRFVISLAPYFLWLLLAAVASLLSLCRREFGYRTASCVYVWLFIVPLLDIANAAFPYLAGSNNDFSTAFGEPSLPIASLIGVSGLLAVICGYYVQSGLYRRDQLSLSSYLALSAVAALLIAAITV